MAVVAPSDALLTHQARVIREIVRALTLLHADGSLWEIRAPKVPKQGTVSGYFDDPALCARAILALDRIAPAVYVTLNPVSPDVRARGDKRLVQRASFATADAEIVTRRNLLIDCDPVRPSGVSATDAEHDAAISRARAIREALTARGWPLPILADSGNGGHLIFRMADLANDAPTRNLIERALKELARRFDDDVVKVDTSVFNAGRIVKLYGTVARKGDSIPERPHRRSHILDAPDMMQALTYDQLQAFCPPVSSPPPYAPQSGSQRNYSGYGPAHIADVPAWLTRLGVAHHDKGATADGTRRYELESCPWGEHGKWKCVVLWRADGSISASCVHADHAGRGLAEFRDALEPGWRDVRGETRQGSKRVASDIPSDGGEDAPPDIPYKSVATGLVRVKTGVNESGKAFESKIPLTNFTAVIVSDTLEDDGAETRRAFEIEATLCTTHRRTVRFSLPADRFHTMNWPTEHLGASAIVYPGQSVREHARVAIQTLSAETGIPERHVYTHTGWRQVEGQWLYLHGGGAIGAQSSQTTISVTLPASLVNYVLPEPPTGQALADAISASLKMLDVAPDTVTAPIFAAIWRAPLGDADFSLHLTGHTGEGKSELTALPQQHFGSAMDARHLPASWSSTGNQLEDIAFHTKDALLAVDDFIPTGSLQDAAKLHAAADRVLRAQGNHSARGRMTSDLRNRPPKPPRGLILSTGEDVPRGQSLQARLLVVEVARGAVKWEKLSLCQRDAAAGLYAQALAGYIQWVAAQYDEVHAAMRPSAIREYEARQVRGQVGQVAREGETHKRTSDITGQLNAAIRLYVRFAKKSGALTQEEADQLVTRIRAALDTVAEAQAAQQAQGEPTRHFLTLLSSAVASGRAHLATLAGEKPGDDTHTWGWRATTVGIGPNMRYDWAAQGEKIGWLDGDNIYLNPAAAFAVAQRLGQATGDPLVITPRTLWKRMRDRALLASWENGRDTNTMRQTCEGDRRAVIHLTMTTYNAAGSLSREKPAQPAQPSHNDDQPQVNGQVLRAGFSPNGQVPNGDLPTEKPENSSAQMDLGRLGRFSMRESGACEHDDEDCDSLVDVWAGQPQNLPTNLPTKPAQPIHNVAATVDWGDA